MEYSESVGAGSVWRTGVRVRDFDGFGVLGGRCAFGLGWLFSGLCGSKVVKMVLICTI